MKRWTVSVTADIPYPWEKTFVVERSGPGTAVSDAIRLYRKVLREEKGKAKKIDSFHITVSRIPDVKPEVETLLDQ